MVTKATTLHERSRIQSRFWLTSNRSSVWIYSQLSISTGYATEHISKLRNTGHFTSPWIKHYMVWYNQNKWLRSLNICNQSKKIFWTSSVGLKNQMTKKPNPLNLHRFRKFCAICSLMSKRWFPASNFWISITVFLIAVSVFGSLASFYQLLYYYSFFLTIVSTFLQRAVFSSSIFRSTSARFVGFLRCLLLNFPLFPEIVLCFRSYFCFLLSLRITVRIFVSAKRGVPYAPNFFLKLLWWILMLLRAVLLGNFPHRFR